MHEIWLVFALIFLFVRFGAGYDSRRQNGKYFVLKNKILRTVLIDKISFLEHNNRLKNDLNKISAVGLVWHIIGFATLILSMASFLFLPKIAVEPFILDQNKLFIYVDSLNELIAVGIGLLYFLVSAFALGVCLIKLMKRETVKWVKILTCVCSALIMFSAMRCIYYVLSDIIIRI